MMLTKVYLSGSRQDSNTISVPLSSSSILFVACYCCPDDLEFVFVNDGFNRSQSVNVCLDALDGFRFQFIEDSENDQECVLPVVVIEGSSLIRSGLCCTIRQIISIRHTQKPNEEYKELLGFRGGSLKACAEVSGWTKLCEVELPNTISVLISYVRNLPSASKGDNSQFTVDLPEDVMKLEWHFQKPPRIHNDDKLKRKLATTFHKEADSFNFQTDLSQFKFEREIQNPHHVLKYRINPKSVQSKSLHSEEGTDCQNQDTSYKCSSESKLDKCEDTCDGINGSTFSNVDDLSSFLKTLTLFDIDLVHQYSEGISITVADLILFTYIYQLLESLSFNKSCLTQNLPNIIKWFDHMYSLPKIQAASRLCKHDINRFKSNGSLEKQFDLKFRIPDKLEEQIDDDEMELSRRCRAKYRAIKPDVAATLDKIKAGQIQVEIGTHPKGDNVEIEWDTLPQAVSPGNDLPNKRVKRKCQQVENLVTAVMEIAKPGDKIVDYCSGGGHVGIVIAYLLPDCKVYLIENKEESLTRAKARIDKLNLSNVTLFQCNMDYFKGKFDIGVCLHACGVATDMVLQQCLNHNAAFVICPCCYGGVQNTHLITYPRSNLFKNAKITSKDYLTLGHAADQTEFNIALEEQGKYCMNLVDTDRASQARERGYTVTLCGLKPLICTPKNNLLIGIPKKS